MIFLKSGPHAARGTDLVNSLYMLDSFRKFVKDTIVYFLVFLGKKNKNIMRHIYMLEGEERQETDAVKKMNLTKYQV